MGTGECTAETEVVEIDNALEIGSIENARTDKENILREWIMFLLQHNCTSFILGHTENRSTMTRGAVPVACEVAQPSVVCSILALRSC